MVAFLCACGSGGSGGSDVVGDTPTAPQTAPEASLSFEPIKTFHFDWADVSGATAYKLLENPDGQSGFTQVGDDIAQGAETLALTVPLHARVNAQYILQACNSAACTTSNTLAVSGTLVDAIGYLKASNTDSGDTLAVGAEGASGAPAAFAIVFQRSGEDWT